MSFDFSSAVKRLSPQPKPRSLPQSARSATPQPSASSPSPATVTSPPLPSTDSGGHVMSPGSISSPIHNSSVSPRPTPSSDMSASPSPGGVERAPSPPIPQHSPVDLFPRVDPRYPDIIATLSNALHYLNKSGFDHDQQHHHLTGQPPSTGAENDSDREHDFSVNSLSSHSQDAARQSFSVQVDANGASDDTADLGEGMITPGGSDSEEDYSSDEEGHAGPRQPARSPSLDAVGHPTKHGGHHSHRRSRSAMGNHADALSNHAEVDEERFAKHDGDFQQSEAPVVPSAFPEVQSVSPPAQGDGLGPVQPEHGQTAPAKASTFPSSRTADLVATNSATSTEPSASSTSVAPVSPQLASSGGGRIVGVSGEPLPPRDAAILAHASAAAATAASVGTARRGHRHTMSEVPNFLSPHSTPPSQSPTLSGSPSHSPRSPNRTPRPRSNSTSAPSPSSPSPASSSATPAPPAGSIVDVQESTKTETTEQTTESETDSTRSVVVTTTTVTTTIVTKTTTIPKGAASTDTAVAWTSSEQSQLLEEILIFYVDLYWENQHSFAPFYKQKLDTWRDKALMIYRHLFQDEKFKSQSKKLLKAPLVDFFEEQLTKKAKMDKLGLPARGGTQGTPHYNDRSLASPSSESYNAFDPPTGDRHVFSPPGSSPSPQPQTTPSTTASGASSPHTLHPPGASSPPEKRRSSFSLPNPLALFSTTPKEPTPEEVEMDAYLARVNQVCGELHKQFVAVSSEINKQLVDNILTPDLPGITCANDLNRAMVSLLHAPQILKALSVYHPLYQDAVVGFPGRVLMSRTLRHRIESLSYLDFNFTDMIVAVNELTEILRKCFQKIASSHPHMIQRLVASQRLMSLRDLHAEYSAERERKRDKGGYAESFSSWLYDSRVYPKLFTPSTFHILQELHIRDAKTFHHLSEHRLQEALWRLKDLNLDHEAATLERLIHEEILGDQQANIADVENLGGGFTTTKLINFPTQDVRGVYKPDSGPIFSAKNTFKLQSLKDSLVSNYRKEIAAYRIDQLLKLNHVPITKLTDYHGEKGSLQYFIQDANVARMVNDVDVHNPQQVGQVDVLTGQG